MALRYIRQAMRGFESKLFKNLHSDLLLSSQISGNIAKSRKKIITCALSIGMAGAELCLGLNTDYFTALN
jgi:hypothetical protein